MKDVLDGHQSSSKANPEPWGQPQHKSSSAIVTARYHNLMVTPSPYCANSSQGSIIRVGKTQITPTTSPERLAEVNKETVPVDPTRYLIQNKVETDP